MHERRSPFVIWAIPWYACWWEFPPTTKPEKLRFAFQIYLMSETKVLVHDFTSQMPLSQTPIWDLAKHELCHPWWQWLWQQQMFSGIMMLVVPKDVSLSKSWEIVKDRKSWWDVVHWILESQTWLSDWKTTKYMICHDIYSLKYIAGLIRPDFNTRYRTLMIKALWYWWTDRYIAKWKSRKAKNRPVQKGLIKF